MNITSVKFKNHPCFKDHWSGLETLLPVTLIIGKNNTGKSHLLHFIKDLCNKTLSDIQWDLEVVAPLDEFSLKQIFRPDTSGGLLGGGHWENHGVVFIDQTAKWTRQSGRGETTTILEGSSYRDSVKYDVADARLNYIQKAMPNATHPLMGKKFRHLLADRDIRPEAESNSVTLASNGSGATNIIRRFINSSESRFDRDLVQVEMLGALNEIFGGDGNFQEITVKHHDGTDPEKPASIWEIFLKQEHKGLVSLSASGSGLKTIFLVLLNLIVMPSIETPYLSDYVFAFEELENNLHPTLLRNLLGYIRSKTIPNPASTTGASPHFFLTTHSNVALDYFTGSEDSQVIHVIHDGKSARTQTIDQSVKLLGVLWDLGTRPSDLLQANGIIWVEGPSDRIYLNKWIELFSDGELKEGRHYQCAFYGGSLLANLQATPEEVANDELINLLKINPNVIVVSDSDKKSKAQHLKPRVRRIRDEFETLNAERSFHWILEAREIENYLTGDLLARAVGGSSEKLSDPGQYESFFPKKDEASYLADSLARKSCDKSDLASLVAAQMEIDDTRGRFDLQEAMQKIIAVIRVWNR